MEREVSTLWLGIQQMNACLHHALMIIASGYGSQLHLVWHCYSHLWWTIHFRIRSMRRERVKLGSEWIAMVLSRRMSFGCEVFFLFFFWQHPITPITHLQPTLHICATDPHTTCNNLFLYPVPSCWIGFVMLFYLLTAHYLTIFYPPTQRKAFHDNIMFPIQPWFSLFFSLHQSKLTLSLNNPPFFLHT